MKLTKQTLKLVLLLGITINVMAEPDNSFSHSLFNNVLTQYVKQGVVDYPGIKNSADFGKYVNSLKEPATYKSRDEALSYWINAYNALAIKGILDGRSPESFFGKIGYFYNAEYRISGKTMNLYDLEHDIIIPIGEPRIHFALNCASASCPVLASEVYLEDSLEHQLENATTAFINDKSRNRFDLNNRKAYLSKIFDWFEEDFSRHSGSVQNFLALYISDGEISNALANNEFEIEYLEYDWSLNGIPPETTIPD